MQKNNPLKGFLNFYKELSMLGKISFLIIAGLILMAVFAPIISWQPHNRSSGPALLAPAYPYILGTDDLGVDIWAMICYGARISLLIGFGTALLAGLGGSMIGIVAGYRGGWTDRLVMRLVDLMVAIPNLPIIIVLAAFFGPSILNIILVLTLFSWAGPARMARSATLNLKEEAYIKMAMHYGGNSKYLLKNHFLPELIPIILVSMTRLTGRAIVTEASLSFLGLADPASKSWGLIINHALNFKGIYFTEFWKWWLLYPWLFLTLFVSSFALLGRELEKIADRRIN